MNLKIRLSDNKVYCKICNIVKYYLFLFKFYHRDADPVRKGESVDKKNRIMKYYALLIMVLYNVGKYNVLWTIYTIHISIKLRPDIRIFHV